MQKWIRQNSSVHVHHAHFLTEKSSILLAKSMNYKNLNKLITNQYELTVFPGACYDFLLVSVGCMEYYVYSIDW